MKYFEYFKYNIEEVFRVNEVSRRPRAVGAFQEVFGVLEVFAGRGVFAIICYISPHFEEVFGVFEVRATFAV